MQRAPEALAKHAPNAEAKARIYIRFFAPLFLIAHHMQSSGKNLSRVTPVPRPAFDPQKPARQSGLPVFDMPPRGGRPRVPQRGGGAGPPATASEADGSPPAAEEPINVDEEEAGKAAAAPGAPTPVRKQPKASSDQGRCARVARGEKRVSRASFSSGYHPDAPPVSRLQLLHPRRRKAKLEAHHDPSQDEVRWPDVENEVRLNTPMLLALASSRSATAIAQAAVSSCRPNCS